MHNAKSVILLAAALMLGACSKSPEVKNDGWGDEPTAISGTEDGYGSSQSGLDGAGIREGEEFGGMRLDAQTLQEGSTIYFDFDSTDIKLEYEELLAAHAGYLVENPGAVVRLEGHTDERGSREYNIGLAERRAQSVRRVLMLQGAQDSQIVTVSFGEERPAEFGSSEEAWAKNRRVEIHY
jgi:peptidoglycan-associated lipoprotein